MKYPTKAIRAVKDYYEYNESKTVTTEEIEKMSRFEVLSIYLEWEGIQGYEITIAKIMGYTWED